MSHVGAANDANDETIQSEVRPKILTSSSKEFRLLRVEIFLVPQESVRPMPLKPCRRVHHAEVVERVLFVTRNSLKSHKERKLLSPVSNTCAITPKLCTHSRPTAFENLASNSQLLAALNSRQRTPHLPRPPSRDFLVWGVFFQGVRQSRKSFVLRQFLCSISKPVSSSRPAVR